MASAALQRGAPLTAGVLDVEHDPDEDTEQLVLRIYLDATVTQTLTFWAGLDPVFDRWYERLDPRDEAISSSVGLRFHWMPDQTPADD